MNRMACASSRHHQMVPPYFRSFILLILSILSKCIENDSACPIEEFVVRFPSWRFPKHASWPCYLLFHGHPALPHRLGGCDYEAEKKDFNEAHPFGFAAFGRSETGACPI